MTLHIGQQLGNYRLVRTLGSGGFAEIYLGEHIHLGTEAAIKVLHAQLTTQDEQKFRDEARIIARLLHPHIIRVLEFGIEGKLPFLVMDYAPHGTLRDHHPHGTRLALDLIISYVKQIADALQYAHSEKLIHRDIKPENMLIGRHKDILLSDFGIAVVSHSTHSQQTQDVIGSVNYMAPEQIRAHPVQASDQYALGVIVYEWLCGSLPFEGTTTEVAVKHLSIPPTAPRAIDATIPPLVEQAILKALEKEPARRFANIKAFANALEQASLQYAIPLPPTILTPPPVTPLPPTLLLRPPSPGIPPPILQRTPSQGSLGGKTIFLYRGHSATVNSVTWSPDSNRIASASSDKTIHIWDATTGQDLNSLVGHSASVSKVAWSPAGGRVASGSWDQTISVWDAKGVFTYRGHSNVIRSLAWSPDSKRLASVAANDAVHVWTPGMRNTRTSIITPNELHTPALWSVAWSPDGNRLAIGKADRTMVMNRSVQPIFQCEGYKHVCWSPDGTLLLAADPNTLFVNDAADGHPIFIYRIETIHSVSWSPNSRYIALANNDTMVHVFHATTGKMIVTYQDHAAIVKTVAWSPDGRFLASAGEDNSVRVWNAPQ